MPIILPAILILIEQFLSKSHGRYQLTPLPKTLERRDLAQFLPCVTSLATPCRPASPSVSFNHEATLKAALERDVANPNAFKFHHQGPKFGRSWWMEFELLSIRPPTHTPVRPSMSGRQPGIVSLTGARLAQNEMLDTE
jgi:hypothetical protein